MRMVKYGAFLALAVLLVLTLSSFGGAGRKTERTELVVFAAASMQETLEEIGADYTARHQDVSIVFNFDSSGTLKTQIQEGADCDIFISAGQKQMDQLDAAVNTEGLDFVLEGSRVDLLENKVALAVPDGNPGGINSYSDLKSALEAGTVLMAMGNSDVPVGQYTQKILNCFGLDEDALADALRTGEIAGVGIDAFCDEPPTGSPLLEMDCVIAAPHIAGSSIDGINTMARMSAQNCIKGLQEVRN